jgi:putative phage-type endonuclease
MQKSALRLVSTKDMERSDWLAVRRQGIGSSDASSAVGLNPYKSRLELWLEKTGRSNTEVSNDAMHWGNVLEPIVAQEYSAQTGYKVRRVNAVLQHPSQPFMLANLDREVVNHPEGLGVLECKTAGHYATKQWEDSVPEWYQLQVLHQLAVTGRKWADVAVLLGGQEFRIYRINRDEDMIQNLIQLEQEFWHLVQTDTQPKADGSESSARALALLYPHDNGTTLDYADDTAMNSLFTNLVEVRTTRQQAEAQEEAIRQQLQEKLGEATVAVFADGKVSWKRSKDGVGVDTKRLLAEHPDLSSQYSMIKPGSRRFTVTLNKGEAA